MQASEESVRKRGELVLHPLFVRREFSIVLGRVLSCNSITGNLLSENPENNRAFQMFARSLQMFFSVWYSKIFQKNYYSPFGIVCLNEKHV